MEPCLPVSLAMFYLKIYLLCFSRSSEMMGNHTNNYAEVGIRIFKDNILCRQKVYNALTLVEFVAVTMEQHLRSDCSYSR